MSFFNKVSNDTDSKSKVTSTGNQDNISSDSAMDSEISDLDKLLDKVLAEKKGKHEKPEESTPAQPETENGPDPAPVHQEIHSVKPSDLLNGLVPETTDHTVAEPETTEPEKVSASEETKPSEESSHSFFSLDDSDNSSPDNAFSLDDSTSASSAEDDPFSLGDDNSQHEDLSSILGDDTSGDGNAADILGGSDSTDASAADVFSSDTDDQSVDSVYNRLFGSDDSNASGASQTSEALSQDDSSADYDNSHDTTYDYDTGTEPAPDYSTPADTTTDTSNDALLVQIDAFRDKAVRLSGLINANQKKVASLETQVKEKEDQIAALQDELSTKQREADALVTTVESQVDRMLVSVKSEFSSFNDDVTGKISKSTRSDAEKLARMMERVNNSVVEIKDYLANPKDDTTLDEVKNELSEKIHSENVKAFRNIQDTLRENDHTEEINTSLEDKYRSLKSKSAVLLVVLILNFGVTIVMFLMNIGMLPADLFASLGL